MHRERKGSRKEAKDIDVSDDVESWGPWQTGRCMTHLKRVQ